MTKSLNCPVPSKPLHNSHGKHRNTANKREWLVHKLFEAINNGKLPTRVNRYQIAGVTTPYYLVMYGLT